MSQREFRTVPEATPDLPTGIPYIVGNEAAERFSYYGMKTILVGFMTKHLLDSSGQLAVMTETDATECYHWFVSANYAIPMLGSIFADVWWGKYNTIIWLSLIYCLGHVALAVDETRIGLFVGLFLIAIGSGGIKPCVSAHLGDQFGQANRHLLKRVFDWFYMAINFGSCFSTVLTPWLLANPNYGPKWAFGIPAVFMGLATLVFWLGRYRYAHIPPQGLGFLRDAVKPQGIRSLRKICLIVCFIAVFWSVSDQTGSKWVLQAERMDRHFAWIEWNSQQFQVANPILVMILVPLFAYVVYPWLSRFITVRPLGKMSVGFFLTALAFGLSGWIELQLQAGHEMNIYWQLLGYVFMTAAEVLIYGTSLEFCYSQAPPSMKSLVMGLNVLSVSMGNMFTALVNRLMNVFPSFANSMEGANYYWFFTAVAFVSACLFVVVALTFQEEAFLQDATVETTTPPTGVLGEGREG
jgi:POT family proton-dependent oligopeptide transporter